MIGLAALPREPSLVWQAAHTEAESAAPLAGSGALDAVSAAHDSPAAKTRASEESKRDTGFMKASGSRAKASDFTMSASRRRRAPPCRPLRRDRKRQARTTPKRGGPLPGRTPRAFSPPPAR